MLQFKGYTESQLNRWQISRLHDAYMRTFERSNINPSRLEMVTNMLSHKNDPSSKAKFLNQLRRRYRCAKEIENQNEAEVYRDMIRYYEKHIM